MTFWGAVVKPGKAHVFVPPPEDWNLHLSQAAIEPTVPDGKRVALAAKSDEAENPIILCTLAAGRADTANLDLFFSQYTEFTVLGDYPIHLTGYFSPAQNMEDEDEDDDDEYAPNALGFPMHGADEDDEGEDDEDDDEDEEDEEDEDMDGLDEDDDEDEEEDEMHEMEMFGFPMANGRKKPHVVIEDVTDGEKDKADGKSSGKSRGEGKGKVANGAKGKAVIDDDEDEDEDESDDEGEEDEDEDEEDEEEEEEPAQQKAAAHAGSKRGAPETRPGVAKAGQPPAKKQAVGRDQPQPAAPKGKETPEPKQGAKAQKQEQEKKKPEQDRKPKDEKPQQQKDAKKDEKPQQSPKDAKKDVKPESKDAKGKKKNIRTHPNGFEVEDVAFGNPNGKLAKPGQKVSVRYAGRLKSNGKVFDKSGPKPFKFRLGVGEVIKGWDLGVDGMRVGDKRRLVIPPQLAYGTSGVKGTIPPNATLEFDVELVDTH